MLYTTTKAYFELLLLIHVNQSVKRIMNLCVNKMSDEKKQEKTGRIAFAYFS